MADTKISALASGAPAQSGDLIVVARGGSNYKLTLAQIFTAGFAATFFSVVVNGADLTVQRSSVGGNVASITYNADNTNAASNAIVQSLVQGASGGDPMTWWNVNGITNWAAGIDNSDSDKWKLSASTALGTNDCIVVTTVGLVTIPLGDFYVSRSSVGGTVISKVENTDNTNAASAAAFYAFVGGASAGDPKILWEVTGATDWVAGIDNSDSDKWKLSAGATLGTNDVLVVDTSKRAYWMARVSEAQGATVASANNLALGSDGNRFQISGTTTINLIDNTAWQGGSRIVLHFQGSLTVAHNVAASGNNKPIMLSGAANFSATADDQLELQYDSTAAKWYEVGRTVI